MGRCERSAQTVALKQRLLYIRETQQGTCSLNLSAASDLYLEPLYCFEPMLVSVFICFIYGASELVAV